MEEQEQEEQQPTQANKIKQTLTIADIMSKDTSSLSAKIEFQHGIIFHMHFVAREALQKLSRDCTIYKYNPKTRIREPDLDTKKLIERFCAIAVEGWQGVTPRSLSKLIPVNLDAIPKEKVDEEVPFSQEQLTVLVAASSEIDAFLQQTATDINFFNQDFEHELGNSGNSQNMN